ncbi:hypothetical protein ACFLYG_02060 [Chloroflexota bacterium]
METTLAVLMLLGIFVGIPAIIGFAIAGTYMLGDGRVRRAERAKALEEAEALLKQPAKAHSQKVPMQVAQH